MKSLIYSVAILVAFGLVGCGGGSSSSDTSSSVEQKPASIVDTATESDVVLDLPAVPQIPADN